MDKNWPYVVAGYGLSFTVLSSYAIWLRAKMKRVEKSLDNQSLGGQTLDGQSLGGQT